MSETAYMGPLDIARRVNADAVALDEVIRLQADVLFSGGADMPSELIGELDAQHPFIEQEVTVDGSVLVAAPDMSDTAESHPLLIAGYNGRLPAGEYAPVHGTYFGFAIHPVYYPDLDMTSPRVMHMVRTGQQTFMDKFHNSHTVTNFMYVCVDGAELTPKLPINAHSLEDLSQDDFAQKIDAMIFAKNRITIPLVKGIAGVTNGMLRHEGHEAEKNKQRISYLNSLGILDGLRLVTRDVAIASSKVGPNEEVLYSDLSNPLTVSPDRLDISYGYTRLANGEVMANGPLEVCAAANMTGDKTLIMPLKSIIDIQYE
ncbi:MAG: hypothetical protein WA843_02460 [Candidatus Saccharimonadales bacterium]